MSTETERKVINCFERLEVAVQAIADAYTRERVVQAVETEKAAARAILRAARCKGCGGGDSNATD